jgi:hypothetical protein
MLGLVIVACCWGVIAAMPPAAMEAAKGGTASFRAWWSNASPQDRAACKPEMQRLQLAASEADALTDPFTTSPASDRTSAPPTDDEIAAQVRAELARRRVGVDTLPERVARGARRQPRGEMTEAPCRDHRIGLLCEKCDTMCL